MQEIREYKVVEAQTLSKLMKFVEKNIQLGFQPFGGVSASKGMNNRIWYQQALVRYEQ